MFATFKNFIFKKKIIPVIVLTVLAVIAATVFLCNKTIVDSAKGKLYSDSKNISFNRVGLLLGTTKSGRTGYDNPYYEYRIQAAIRLIQDKKIKYLLISGDNSRESYNEPELMRFDLIHAGVDSSIIYLDYAGFRTFDSVVRLKKSLDRIL